MAFYSGDALGTGVLRDRLGDSLPEYMIPAAFHRRESLPLTANGKTDRKALTALADALDGGAGTEPIAGPDSGPDSAAPRGPAERRVAAAWSAVLGLPRERIGRRDHFFDRGGTSLSAVKLAVALDRAVSLADITRHPVLADLAELIDGAQPSESAVPSVVSPHR